MIQACVLPESIKETVIFTVDKLEQVRPELKPILNDNLDLDVVLGVQDRGHQDRREHGLGEVV